MTATTSLACEWLQRCCEKIAPMKTDTSTLAPLVQRQAWKALQAHSQEIQQTNLRALFAADSGRGDKFVAEAEGLFLDYSKNRITDETLKLLIQLAEESG